MDYSRFDQYRPSYPVRRRGKDDFIPALRMPENFLDTIREIRRYEEEFKNVILTTTEQWELVVDAFSTNIHHSTELEGNPLPLQEVKRITRNTLRGNMENRPDMPTQEIIQHITVLFYPSFLSFPWTIEKIKEAHRCLFSYDSENHPGEFRESADDGFGVGNENTGQMYFRPTCGTHVQKEMEQFVEWVNHYAVGYEPLAAVAALFHEFESIHPFHEGNGRMGRVLLHCYIQRCGFWNSYLCKIDKHLLANKELYYRLLAWTDKTLDYTPLVDYMSTAILESYKEAYKTISSKNLLSENLDGITLKLLQNAREKTIKDAENLQFPESNMLVLSKSWDEANDIGWFSVSDAVRWIGDLSSATIRKYLNNLVEMDALESEGQTKAKRYRFIPIETAIVVYGIALLFLETFGDITEKRSVPAPDSTE